MSGSMGWRINAGRAVNNNGLTFLYMQRVVDALKCGQPSDRNRARMFEVERLGYMSDAFRCHGDVFGVEATLWIVPGICKDAVAWLEPANARSHGGDNAGTVGAEHKWKMYAAARRPTIPHVRVPPANPRRVDCDKHFVRAKLWHGKGMDRQHCGSARMVDCGPVHGFRDGMHVESLGVNAHRQPLFSPAAL